MTQHTETTTPAPGDGIEAFFALEGDTFFPGRHAIGPWGADMMNGRTVGGILAHRLEDRHGDPAFQPARLTVDLLRPTGMAPFTVRTTSVREGRRIRIADAELVQVGHVTARASLVLLRRSEQPPGEVWQAADPIGAPLPPAEVPESRHELLMWPFGHGEFDAGNRMSVWEGGARKGAWLRENRALVEGVELTPFVRAALAGDVASPLTGWGTAGLQYINADYTLTLSRLPEGPDIGLQAVSHLSVDGVATGSVTVYDRLGPIGTCSIIALANSAAAFYIPRPTDGAAAG
ncbi:acyl-CoA thioesterase domain-containing protein [Actinocorallia herbida]|uniref:acyl-CoA thioesterase domain-containing protein n=1 Tax=Actinocorallia herbida TaxID=58109 RepID=UPI001FE476D7|nr:acyl-CoA thioesterase domain-containing protein [Actinocorallia herbida]